MSPKPNLRAVQPDDQPPASRQAKSVAQAAASGNHRELLVAMRERIARAVTNPDCPPRDLAALTRRLQDIAKEIEAIDMRAKQESEENGDTGDETWDESAI